MKNKDIVTVCCICGEPLAEKQSRSPDPEVYGEEKAELDFCIPHYIAGGYLEECNVRMRVVSKRGIKYERITLEIDLPEELYDWQLVPAFLYGAEVSKYPKETLLVNLRKLKKGGNDG